MLIMQVITSKDNEIVKQIKKLKGKKVQRRSGSLCNRGNKGYRRGNRRKCPN